jgi:transcriptional regulator with XRE-family HTH domain
MAKSFDTSELAARLRQLQGKQDWTVQEMASLADLPKRSLENYMRKVNPQVPSAEVLAKMANAYSVPVDWLLFGTEAVAQDQARLVRLCTRAASAPYIKSFRSAAEAIAAKPGLAEHILADGKMLGLTDEEWAMEVANEAGKRAEAIIATASFQHSVRVAEVALNHKPAVKDDVHFHELKVAE